MMVRLCTAFHDRARSQAVWVERSEQEDLRAILKSGIISKSETVSFTKQDIEMDANVLMNTGLFRSVKPITPPADANSSPAFFFDNKGEQSLVFLLFFSIQKLQ